MDEDCETEEEEEDDADDETEEAARAASETTEDEDDLLTVCERDDWMDRALLLIAVDDRDERLELVSGAILDDEERCEDVDEVEKDTVDEEEEGGV